jgi:hypothetical protein
MMTYQLLGALSIGICLRNFLVHPARTRRQAGNAPVSRSDVPTVRCLKA